MSSTENTMIVLKSSDEKTFEVEEAVDLESLTIKHMIQAVGADTISIPLPNVTSKILVKVIEYCKRHVDACNSSDVELQNFYAEFIKVDQDTFFGLNHAADYLNIESLLNLTSTIIADMIMNMTDEEICQRLNIRNDFTQEEEYYLRMVHPSVFYED